MENTTPQKVRQALDETNARHVNAAEKWLAEGNVTEACKELRSIQRIAAGHPAVIRLRRRLVSVICGLDETPAAVPVQSA